MHTLYKNIFAFCLLALMAVSSAQATEEISYMLTAAGKGDLAAVNAMLNSGASANVKDADGITALMYAARKNNAEVASALLNKGADVNAKDNGGWTALMFAAKKNYIDTIEVLLSHHFVNSLMNSFRLPVYSLKQRN